MTSRFTRAFKKSDGDEQRAFQTRVLMLLRELHPDKSFSGSDDPLTIGFDEQTLGLTNIRSNFLLSSQTEGDFRDIVSAHFQSVLAGFSLTERDELDWERSKGLIKPQLMPIEFLERVPLISRPFGEGIVLGFVIDSEKAYSYVSKADVDRWGVDEQEILDTAIENLKEASTGMQLQLFPGENAFAVVNSMDGFDAARITLPELREIFSENISTPFYFGVPNRDFLICWAKSGDTAFQQQMRSQISQDFDERPYPLSRSVFEALENGEIRQVEHSASDPRAASAENN
jgi:hypothetical protein